MRMKVLLEESAQEMIPQMARRMLSCKFMEDDDDGKGSCPHSAHMSALLPKERKAIRGSE